MTLSTVCLTGSRELRTGNQGIEYGVISEGGGGSLVKKFVREDLCEWTGRRLVASSIKGNLKPEP